MLSLSQRPAGSVPIMQKKLSQDTGEGDCALLARTLADVCERRLGDQATEPARPLPGHAEQTGTQR
jgi:hypothetical protein